MAKKSMRSRWRIYHRRKRKFKNEKLRLKLQQLEIKPHLIGQKLAITGEAAIASKNQKPKSKES